MDREPGVIRRRIVVRGRVQGVGFRWFVRENALALGLAGQVWNRADGAVELELEGDPPLIDQLLEQIRIGPTGAAIEGLEVVAASVNNGILPNPFTIKR
jgi:acylphosphatase